MSGALVIFVKTPGLSPVKTRLSVKLGLSFAEAFHLKAADAVREVVQCAGRRQALQGYFAVAEQSALTHPYWRDLPCLWQGEGGLGERMAHVYHGLLRRHAFVILVGADIPQMTVAELVTASTWLHPNGHPRMAFGPSEDGGFWLFGGNREVPAQLWTEVIYSVADTGAQFFSRIERLGTVRTLTPLCDVDEVSDVIRLRRSLAELAEPLPAQRELHRFLKPFDDAV